MNPLRILLERDGIQREVTLEGESALIGRGQECDVHLEDPMTSRKHCRIERLGSETFVVDLDSANGTWVGGEKVQRRPILPGDCVVVGSTTISIQGGGLSDRITAIESTQTQSVSREKDSLQTVLSVLHALRHEGSLERASTLLIDASVSLSRAERGFVFLVENGNIDLAIGRNFAREPVPAPEKKLSRTLLERAMDHDGPLLIRDAAHDGDFAGVASISDLGLRSLLAIPLRHGGDLLGVLMVDHRMASGAFKQEELVLLNGLADAASTALGAVRDRSRSAKLRRQVSRLKRQLGRRVQAESEEERRLAGLKSLRFGNIVGASPQLSELFRDMERLMESDASILIQGESGSGKELVARAIHDGGLRSGKPFVVENCGALPDTLLESELFGHLKGAFTGATCDKKGRFEEAHRGTLFLDEVGEMSEAMQQRLLRVLENGEIRRLGSSEIKQVDVRIIAATNRDLRTEVDEGRFREDLFFRLNVLLLELPPLRDRDGDIPLLAEHFLALEGAELGRPRRTLTPGAVAHLESLAWPGNVRQLHNEMRRLSLMGEGEIQPEELSSELAPLSSLEEEVTDSTGTLPERIGRLEKLWIQESLDRQHGNRTKAAKELGLTRYTLLRKIEKYEMDGGKGAPPE